MADNVNKSLNEESMDCGECPGESSVFENNHAECITSAEDSSEENSRNVGIGKKDKHADIKLLPAVTEQAQLDPDESAGFDPDEFEMEEDDITSKLLSIQVLPRIPKRKPVTDNSTTTPVDETSSYCSVLERVNSTPSSVGARYPNWSSAGWSRSNIDRPPKQRWSRKNINEKKTELKPMPIKQSVTEKRPKIDVKRKVEVSEKKAKRAAEHSAWSPNITDVSSCPSLSEVEQISADEGSAPSLAGPLPTLPFEEQMKERARLRNLKKQGGSHVGNNSSDATETVAKNFDSSDKGKDGVNFAAAASIFSNKRDRPSVTKERQDARASSSANNSALLHTKSSEKRRSSQWHVSENGHKANKPHHHRSKVSAEDKAKRSNVSRKDIKSAETNRDDLMPKSKIESDSPPLPHLPILPLFATNSSETINSSSHRVDNKTSGKRSTALSTSGQTTSARNDIRDTGSANVSKLKSVTSATSASSTSTAVSKNVTFNCNTKTQEGSSTKRKSKSNVG